jgi:hypothetical protein
LIHLLLGRTLPEVVCKETPGFASLYPSLGVVAEKGIQILERDKLPVRPSRKGRRAMQRQDALQKAPREARSIKSQEVTLSNPLPSPNSLRDAVSSRIAPVAVWAADVPKEGGPELPDGLELAFHCLGCPVLVLRHEIRIGLDDHGCADLLDFFFGHVLDVL